MLHDVYPVAWQDGEGWSGDSVGRGKKKEIQANIRCIYSVWVFSAKQSSSEVGVLVG